MQAGMELRVLYAVAHQMTWYGEWGYEFGRGPFSITKTTWRATLKNVHSVSMANLLSDFTRHTSDAVLPEIIDRYQVPPFAAEGTHALAPETAHFSLDQYFHLESIGQLTTALASALTPSKICTSAGQFPRAARSDQSGQISAADAVFAIQPSGCSGHTGGRLPPSCPASKAKCCRHYCRYPWPQNG